MRVILFRGYRKTGKTTMMTAAIRALVRRGRRVAAVKHSPHLHLGEDDTDSGRFFREGAVTSLLMAADGRLGISRHEEEGEPCLDRLIGDVAADYVLVEGFKSYAGDIPNLVFGHDPGECAGLVVTSTVGWAGWFLGGPEARESARSTTGLPLLFPGMEEERLADFIEEKALSPTP
jgi:molybdopterin-guanine dinucleotide biosynthesis protein MobB